MNAPAISERLEVLRFVRETEFELPVLPTAAGALMRSMHDPDTDAAKVSRSIHRDQGLAAHVLRLANSPYYQPRTPIHSLQQAVARLGIQTVHEMALAACFATSAFRIRGHVERTKRLWRHALATGLVARDLGRRAQVDVDMAFLCGLLHDIGRPVVLSVISRRDGKQRSLMADDVLDEVLDRVAPHVGMRLAEAWSLPDAVQQAIAHHADITGASLHHEAVALTALARMVAAWIIAPDGVDTDAVYVHPAVGALRLPDDAIDSVLATASTVSTAVNALHP